MRAALIIALIALPAFASASQRDVLYGTWGTAKQCAREPLRPGLTVNAEPVVIGPQWLRQGAISCLLTWFPIEPRGDGIFTGAYAQCGEDAVRAYALRMFLSGGALTIRWDFLVSNGPLGRCSGP